MVSSHLVICHGARRKSKKVQSIISAIQVGSPEKISASTSTHALCVQKHTRLLAKQAYFYNLRLYRLKDRRVFKKYTEL